MLTRIQISSFIGLTIVIWLIALWIQGMPILSSEFLKPFSLVVGAITIILSLFNKYAWTWKIFEGWYIERPNLQGTWKIELKSDWINPETGSPIAPIIGFATIRQTLTSLTFRIFTKESESKSIAYSIEKEDDGLFKLNVIYQNQPSIELRGKRSEIHHGSFILNISGSPVTSLKGHYWTDRSTRGAMHLTMRTMQFFDNFEIAQEQFSKNIP